MGKNLARGQMWRKCLKVFCCREFRVHRKETVLIFVEPVGDGGDDRLKFSSGGGLDTPDARLASPTP
jgi:hypothetical protein